MKRIGIAGLSAALVMTVCAGTALAGNITSKKMLIKDNPTPAKRQIQAFSGDAGVAYTDADSPGTKGMSIHIYSATDDQCIVLPASPTLWTDKAGKSWKYKNPTTKNQAQIADGKLQVKIRSGVTITLGDDFPQDAVNMQIQFGDTGERFCMRCGPGTKDTDTQFQGKDCAAVACDVEAPGCIPTATTTTTTSTTTTTMPALPGTILKAVLPQTNGNFSFAMTSGLAGANTLCNSTVAGTHACTYSELQAAELAGDLDNIKDINGMTVTGFWAIDPLRPDTAQCIDVPGGSVRWHYATGHLGVGGDFVNLTNATGVLSSLHQGGDAQGGPRNCAGVMAGHLWVGCCP